MVLKMELQKLHDPANGQMRVVGLMSGSGTNLCKIIEHEYWLKQSRGTSPYTVIAIFSDNTQSKATEIGKKYDLPVVVRDIQAFYAARGKPRKDREVRIEFDSETVKVLSPFEATVAAYAGYMSFATEPLITAFLGINVHPADLSLTTEDGKRKYTGDRAVKKAIVAGEQSLRSTTHMIENVVDYGRILMISSPIEVMLPPEYHPTDEESLQRLVDEHQNRLKERGDWRIFPKTLEWIADGRYAVDSKSGQLFFDGKPIPQGIRLD